jgi:molybdenum cofactor biosynthesis protein B
MTAVSEHRQYAPHQLGFAVVTISDSRTPETDTSGEVARRLISEAGHRVLRSAIVRDEVEAIDAEVSSALEEAGIDVVVATGGTGFSPRDVTLDALAPLLTAEVPGFGELFRMLSHREVGAAAMLSRAAAGLVGTKAVFALPGSPKAVELALRELVLPEVGHLLGQVRR